MRLALVSDIHGNLPALEAVVKDMQRRGVDAVINLGDSLSGPLMPLETAQFLMAQDWVHLAGNHERQLLASGAKGLSDEFAYSQLGATELLWLATLKPCQAYSPEILLCHGTPSSDIEYLLETLADGQMRMAKAAEIRSRLGEQSAELIACGHTHIPRSIKTVRGQLIINPGSVGLPAYEDNQPFYHKVENGSPDARYAIVERQKNNWQSLLISVPYHHKAMAKLALARGRSDWYVSLLSGFLS
jgi:putative phosphoesterase